MMLLGKCGLAGLCVGVAIVALPCVVAAQSGHETRHVASAAEARGEPDMIEQIGRWFDRSINDLNAGLKDSLSGVQRLGHETRAAVHDAAREADKARASLSKLQSARIIHRRQLCEPAANGGPDCRRAALTVCRSNGFATGSSFEVQSEEKCPVEVLMAHRKAKPGECRSETYVVQSMCQ